jgi:hypothetical protein
VNGRDGRSDWRSVIVGCHRAGCFRAELQQPQSRAPQQPSVARAGRVLSAEIAEARRRRRSKSSSSTRFEVAPLGHVPGSDTIRPSLPNLTITPTAADASFPIAARALASSRTISPVNISASTRLATSISMLSRRAHRPRRSGVEDHGGSVRARGRAGGDIHWLRDFVLQDENPGAAEIAPRAFAATSGSTRRFAQETTTAP